MTATPWWHELESQYQTYLTTIEDDATAAGFLDYLCIQGYFDHIPDDDGIIQPTGAGYGQSKGDAE